MTTTDDETPRPFGTAAASMRGLAEETLAYHATYAGERATAQMNVALEWAAERDRRRMRAGRAFSAPEGVELTSEGEGRKL